MTLRKILLGGGLLGALLPLSAQMTVYRPITAAMPSLQIAPDARAAALGDQGLATSPDLYAQYWNAAKYAFMESPSGVALGYTPWLRELVDDIALMQLVGYWRLPGGTGRHTLSSSLRYFSIGRMTMWDELGRTLGEARPHELAFDLGYSYRINKLFSAAAALRYVRSDQNLVGEHSAGSAVIFDLSGYMDHPLTIAGRAFRWTAGLSLSNLGSKISFDGGTTKVFLPATLSLGTGLRHAFDTDHSLALSVQLTKLLVPAYPTSSAYATTSAYQRALKDYREMSAFSGIFKSFSDAPNGLSEELKEIRWAIGAEYSYQEKLFLRAGYSYLSPEKGNLQGLALGAGFRWRALTLDMAYLISTIANNPLDQTLRFSLAIELPKVGDLFR